ncbi:MAG: hypothetical protein ACLFR0_07560 [Alphaproteobacteria bacterium]
MSLTVTSWTLIGAFAGAATGLWVAYPDSPKNYLLAGAFAGAITLGGGNYITKSTDFEFDNFKSIFVVPDATQN